MISADTGSVTIEEADDEHVVGSFEFSAEGVEVRDRVIKAGFVA